MNDWSTLNTNEAYFLTNIVHFTDLPALDPLKVLTNILLEK